MALTGSFTYKGITIPEAYVVANSNYNVMGVSAFGFVDIYASVYVYNAGEAPFLTLPVNGQVVPTFVVPYILERAASLNGMFSSFTTIGLGVKLKDLFVSESLDLID